MIALSVRRLRKSFGSARVLHDVDLDVVKGSITAIVGPSGCGKTTLLRVIAGFERPDVGTVSISGVTVCDHDRWVPPHRRDLGYVAQDGALFPHLSVAQNIAFGLPRRQRHSSHRVAELLELVSLPTAIADRRPDQLSGGQQQRVSLARALAPQPHVVLLDEPFSALDASLRAGTRTAVAHALSERGVTALLVTHDQAEALSFADQIGVMSDGRLTQVATPRQVYEEPADLTTATFVGDAVALPASLAGPMARCALGDIVVSKSNGARDGRGTVVLRPEQLRVVPPTGGAASTDHTNLSRTIDGTVQNVEYFGHDAMLRVRLANSDTVISVRHPGSGTPSVAERVQVQVCGPARWFADNS